MSIFNYYNKKQPTLKDLLGVPFGHDILTNLKPATVENKTIDYNKNQILNLPAGFGGEANTTSNEGTGEGTLALPKDNINLPFKTIKAGTNVTITNNAQDVTINSSGGGGGAPDPHADTHLSNGTDPIAQASTTIRGTVELATDGENLANVVVQGNDSRLSDARTPLAHTHVKANITDFAHTHVKADVTDFSHTHVKADVTDFAHNHVTADITDFPDVGEDNTNSNAGTGEGQLVKTKVGVDTPIKTIKAGANITVTNNADDVTIATGGGVGEANTMSNQGTGEGTLAMTKNGVDLPVKSIKAGTNVTITNNANDVTINSTGGGGGEANTNSNQGTGEGTISMTKSGVDLPLKTLKQGSNITITNNAQDITLASAYPPDASTTVKGIVELAANNESAASLAVQSNDDRMSNARTPTAHTHIKSEITDFAHTHLIADLPVADDGESNINEVTRSNDTRLSNARAPTAHTHIKSEITDFSHTHVTTDITDFPDVGEDNTSSNVGTGEGQLAKTKSGVDLPFKTIKAGTNITVTNNADDVTIASTGGAGEANTTSNEGTGEGTLAMTKSGVNLPFKTLKQGTNVTLTNNTNDVTITSAYPPDGSTTVKGIVELATDGETASGVAVQGNDARLSDSRAPTGSIASGDLAGSSYPNPTIANDVVTYAKIQNVASDDVLLGRISGANGNIEEVTPAQARTLLGITSENVGTATGAANGSSTVFNIAHSLGSTPYMAMVQVSSVLASDINFSFTYDSTNIVVTFASAPSTGTITFQWRAVA